MNGENLGELFAALAMARQEFGALTKGKSASIKSDKGSYGYTYADLSDVIEATAAALAKHGLVIIQEPEVVSENGRQMVVINGCIAHKSGGVYSLRPLPLPVTGGTAQAIGSAISYGRRYQLTAALNLAAADDDGDEASSGAVQKSQAQAPRLPSQQKAQQTKRAVDATTGEIKDTSNPFDDNVPTDAELEILGKWATPDDAFAWAVEHKACNAVEHAKNSLKKLITDQFGGKFNTANAAAVYLALLRHWTEKIEQAAKQEPEVAF